MTISAKSMMDALRLQAEGRVAEFEAPRVFRVEGDSGAAYVVVLADEQISCSCPATTTCKHIAAAGLSVRG